MKLASKLAIIAFAALASTEANAAETINNTCTYYADGNRDFLDHPTREVFDIRKIQWQSEFIRLYRWTPSDRIFNPNTGGEEFFFTDPNTQNLKEVHLAQIPGLGNDGDRLVITSNNWQFVLQMRDKFTNIKAFAQHFVQETKRYGGSDYEIDRNLLARYYWAPQSYNRISTDRHHRFRHWGVNEALVRPVKNKDWVQNWIISNVLRADAMCGAGEWESTRFGMGAYRHFGMDACRGKPASEQVACLNYVEKFSHKLLDVTDTGISIRWLLYYVAQNA